MSELAVRIVGADVAAMEELRKRDVDLVRRSGGRRDDGGLEVTALVTREEAQQLQDGGYEVEQRLDLQAEAERAQSEVSRENRFADGMNEEVFKGGVTPHYMETEEIASYVPGLAGWAGALAHPFEMPEKSWEGRTIPGVVLAAGDMSTSRPAVLIQSGVHAREWGGPDACCWLAYRLLAAYQNGQGISLGGFTASAEWVKHIMERLYIPIVPLINPDGRAYSQYNDPNKEYQGTWWRRNRNPSGAVDLNRNYDILWDEKIGSSDDTNSSTYRGKSAFSEPETRNVRWLVDWYRYNLWYFLDCHSQIPQGDWPANEILFSWGDDDDQWDRPEQNFTNASYRGIRGQLKPEPQAGDYGEYIEKSDWDFVQKVDQYMCDGANFVRDRGWKPMQSVGLFATGATGDDYAYSRHRVDSSRMRTYAYTLEHGPKFSPPIGEMLEIIDNINAAQLSLLMYAAWAAPEPKPARAESLIPDASVESVPELELLEPASASVPEGDPPATRA